MRFSRAIFTAAALSLAAVPAFAQDEPDPTIAPSGEYVTDSGHAYITFSYLHQGYSRPFLRWGEWTGTLDWNADAPSESSVDVNIVAASIDSGVEKFDDHLKSADFFEVETYPSITFKSSQIKTTGPTTGEMTGVLKIKDQEKPVTLDVTFNRAGETQNGGHKIGFSARGQVKRSDFGVDKYVPFVGDDVDLIIEVEFEKPQA
ncbi:MAG: polyisoprenoid-binding protein [Alphaproteobacteria bacterium]|nr:polyisoprenoid-binding protein [Alphaproteobacteria bacterium]